MRELRDILSEIAVLRARREPAALATITRVRGSTYRRAGARLVIRPAGRAVGPIGGGCLGGDVVEAARAVMQTGRPRMLTYDLTADDDAVWGLGLGCNGAIDVFVEPLGRADELDVASLLQGSIGGRRPAAMAPALTSPSGGPPV